jgi:glycosyltransferase involved in cell wall biosynthesis
MKLSIIIPVFNEENTIQAVVKKIIALKLPCRKEIIIVNDGSTDATADKINNLTIEYKNLKILTHKQNSGKGAAIRTGVKQATGNYILIQDADLEYNPQEIWKLLSAINNNAEKPQAIYGSRFKINRPTMPFLYYLGNIILTSVTNLLYGCQLTDMETGYKLLPAKSIKELDLQSNRFDLEPEITAKLIKNNYQIIEVPINYRGRSHLAGKKITIKDSIGAIITLLKYRLV